MRVLPSLSRSISLRLSLHSSPPPLLSLHISLFKYFTSIASKQRKQYTFYFSICLFVRWVCILDWVGSNLFTALTFIFIGSFSFVWTSRCWQRNDWLRVFWFGKTNVFLISTWTFRRDKHNWKMRWRERRGVECEKSDEWTKREEESHLDKIYESTKLPTPLWWYFWFTAGISWKTNVVMCCLWFPCISSLAFLFNQILFSGNGRILH